MNIVKEFKATSSFHSLDAGDKGCQENENVISCHTKHYVDTLLHACGCLPLSIASYQDKVSKESYYKGT